MSRSIRSLLLSATGHRSEYPSTRCAIRGKAAIRAFDILFHACATDPHCNATYPHLQSVFYRLVADLNIKPITFQVTSQTGKSFRVHFTGNDLVLWLRQSLYFTWFIPQLPAAIFQIRQHDYTLLSKIYGSSSNPTMSAGLFYSVLNRSSHKRSDRFLWSWSFSALWSAMKI